MIAKVVPEAKYADVGDGITMHYHDVGDGERGVVMYVHGSGPGASGWSNFKRNYPYLADRGYRVIVPDTLGYGYTTKPTSGEYSLDQIAVQFKTLLDSLDVPKVTLVGNSQGGAITIKMALNYTDFVEKLILMAPGGIESRETYMSMNGISTMLRVIFKDGISRESMRKLFELQVYDASKITSEIIEERYQIAVTQPKDNIARIKVDNLESELSNLRCPVLCFWGANDQFCPATGAHKIAMNCKNSRTMLISECGHWVMVEYAKLFNELSLKFLKDELG